jgi:hypothetical protein
VRCPVCEWDAPAEAVDCERCGKVLRSAATATGFAPPVDGLEQTLHPRIDATVDPLTVLEPTALDDGGIPLPEVSIPVERTQIDASAAGPSSWSGAVELEPGREHDGGPRTPAPSAEGPCPFCGAAATGLVCDACGRRRSVAKRDGEAQGAAERQLCPACFGRVLPYHDVVTGVLRCSECGVPLPLLEAV